LPNSYHTKIFYKILYFQKFILSFLFVISRLFQKWCSSGVVSALACHEIIDFTGFFRTFYNTAVAHE
ncbi:MAG: hypothetical protein NC541_12050, partial [bacterium]|nr:hypothetical protein [bacterium]